MMSAYDTDANRGMLIAATPGESDQKTNAWGLRQNHAYTVLKVETLANGQRVIKMRNPWRSETFTGAYSDGKMNSNIREELDHTVGNDGVFYMSLEQYYSQVEVTSLNYDTSNWKYDYFLKLDDDGHAGKTGKWSWCGYSCTRYTVKVKNTSSVANKVWVGAHTWRQRSYPQTNQCSNAFFDVDTKHSIYL